MKRLYAARVAIDMYVMAEDEKSAAAEVNYHFDQERPEISVRPVGVGEGVRSEWIGAVPYGADDDRTVDQVINAMAVSR